MNVPDGENWSPDVALEIAGNFIPNDDPPPGWVGNTAHGDLVFSTHSPSLEGVFGNEQYQYDVTIGNQGDCYLELSLDDAGDVFLFTVMLGNGTSKIS